MEFSIQEILKKRIEASQNNSLEQRFILEGREYQKKWAQAVQFFQKRINKDMRKEKKKEYDFIPIRQKLIALREIDDMRWFYEQCLKYSYTKDKKTGKRNTFSKCFFGALKIKNSI